MQEVDPNPGFIDKPGKHKNELFTRKPNFTRCKNIEKKTTSIHLILKHKLRAMRDFKQRHSQKTKGAREYIYTEG